MLRVRASSTLTEDLLLGALQRDVFVWHHLTINCVAMPTDACENYMFIKHTQHSCKCTCSCSQASVVQSTSDSTEQLYEQTEKVVADLKTKWEKTEEKPAAIGLTVAAFVGLYVANGIVNALDTIPIISGVLELVGIFVTSWFVYRYLVFGPGKHLLTATMLV